MDNLNKQLFELLQLHSPSGNEINVRNYIRTELEKYCDDIEIDSYGNLYAVKRVGDDPYTVLLSAHMDTVAKVAPDVQWRHDFTEIYNANGLGALGGDDKCGITVFLAVLRNIKNTDFTGTLKLLFSREEELGCVGAEWAAKLRPDWFHGIDACIVVDRRDGEDIVRGMWDVNYCHDSYGEFWEDMSDLVGFNAVACNGSISDTMVWAEEFGINGVNLSAGYYKAHTKDEYIKVSEVQRTLRWVLMGLSHIQEYEWPEFEYVNEEAIRSTGSELQGYDEWWEITLIKEDIDIELKHQVDFCNICGNTVDQDEVETLTSDFEDDDVELQVCPNCYVTFATAL